MAALENIFYFDKWRFNVVDVVLILFIIESNSFQGKRCCNKKGDMVAAL